VEDKDGVAMHGLFVDGKRPLSKVAIREAILDNPNRVRLEDTSLDHEYDGKLSLAPNGNYVFVVPSHRDRRFYGVIKKSNKGIRVI